MLDNCDFENYWRPPAWLNEDFLTKTLRNTENHEPIKIHSLSIKPAIAKGEHFASCMYRISVAYSVIENSHGNIKTVSLICKTINLDETVNSILEEYNIYEQELKMYSDVLPEFHEILKNSNIITELAPRALYIDHNENSIMFEDLNVKGYKMTPRAQGLDSQHAKLVLSKLAYYQAASLVYNERHSNVLAEYFTRGMFNRKTDGINTYFSSNLAYLADEVNTWSGWEYFAKKLYRMRDRLIENAKKIFDPVESDFNVLVHGDLWVNNIMFRYDADGQPNDALMVDFQMPTWGCPSIDVLYFLATSLTDTLRENHQDEFIQYYHRCLSKTLQKLNYTDHIPTLHELQMQFFRKYFYSFTSTVLVLPVIMSENSDGIDFGTLMGMDDISEDFKKRTYRSEKFHKILKTFLPYFDKKGILDM